MKVTTLGRGEHLPACPLVAHGTSIPAPRAVLLALFPSLPPTFKLPPFYSHGLVIPNGQMCAPAI